MPSANMTLVYYQHNTHISRFTLSHPQGGPVDLTDLTVELIIKPVREDDDEDGVTLSTENENELTIVDAEAGRVDARVGAPITDNAVDQFFRIDIVDSNGDRKTCGYGTVQVNDV